MRYALQATNRRRRRATSELRAAALVAALAAVALAVAIILPLSGISPVGEAAFRARIAQEGGALCARFGFGQEENLRSAACKAELADLHRDYQRLLLAYTRF